MQTQNRFEVLSLGGLLDRTLRIYLENPLQLLVMASLPSIPMLLVSVVVQTLGVSDPTVLMVGGLLLAVISVGYLLAIYPLTAGAVTFYVANLYLGRTVTLKAAFQAAFDRYWTLLFAQFVVGLLVGIGMICLVIPGIYVMIGYLLVTPVVMMESLDANQSRDRAWSLSNGYRLNIFLLLFIIGLINGVVNGGLGVMFALLPQSTLMTAVYHSVISLESLIVAPIWPVLVVLIYYNRRIEVEGFDLELLAQSVDGVDPDSLPDPHLEPPLPATDAFSPPPIPTDPPPPSVADTDTDTGRPEPPPNRVS